MRVGVVGLGSIGRRHVGNLLAMGCEVAAIDVSETARARAKVDFPTAQIGDSLFFGWLDALVITTPWDRHLEWVEEAIRRQLPVFTEKPLGSLEQLPRWREIAALSSLTVTQVGYNWRFNQDVWNWRDRWVNEKESLYLGCDVNMAQWPGQSYGPPLLECSHDVDLLRWLRKHEPVVTRVDSFPSSLFLEFGVDVINLCWAQAIETRLYYTRRRHGGREDCRLSPHSLAESYRDELAHFLLCVRENIPTNVPLSEGLATLELCAQIASMAKVPA